MPQTPNSVQVVKHILKNVAVSVAVSPDEDGHVWDGDGPDPETYDVPLYPHNIEVVAHAIVEGVMHEGASYLGGSYYEYNVKVRDVLDDEAGGYLNDLVREALEDLAASIRGCIGAGPVLAQIKDAIAVLSARSEQEYLANQQHARTA